MAANARAALNDERRWTTGARLSGAFVAAVLGLALARVLIGFTYPTDGWTSQRDAMTGYVVFEQQIAAGPSPLQEGDQLVAIAGRALQLGRPIPLPESVQVGQMLRYSIQRGGQTLDLDVTLVIRRPLDLARSIVRAAGKDLINNFAMPVLVFAVSLFVFLRRPNELAARVMLVGFLYLSAGPLIASHDVTFFVEHTYPAPLRFLDQFVALGWMWLLLPSLTLLPLVFPDRKWLVRRWPRAVPLVLYGYALVETAIAVGLSSMTPGLGYSDLPAWVQALWIPQMIVLFPALFGGLAHSFLTVRDPVQRSQLRWVGFGLGVGFGGFFLVALAGLVIFGSGSPEADAMWRLVRPLPILLPICMAVAILRYRLFDINVIINRTLVYVPLTAILAGVYSATISLTQKAFVAATGEKSDAAVVLTTVILVSLFTPVKNALQGLVDKRFKEQPDPMKELKRLTAQGKQVVEVLRAERFAAQVVDEAVRAFDATGGAIYLAANGRGQPVHATAEWTGEPALTIPLESDGLRLGEFQLGRRRDGSPYGERAETLLRESAAVVAQAVQLAPDTSPR